MESTGSVKIPGFKSANKEMSMGNPGIAVIGTGNILLKDEGIGVHIAQRLSKVIDMPEVEVIDAGTSADILMLIRDSVKHVIIIDAASAGGSPGDIYRFTPEDIDTVSDMSVSLHQNNLVANIKMLPLYDRKLESVTIFGIEPADMGCSLELSPVIAEKVPQLMELVKKEITNLIQSMEDKR